MVGIAFVDFGFFGADDDAGGKKFGAKSFGEAKALSVFAGHRESEDVD